MNLTKKSDPLWRESRSAVVGIVSAATIWLHFDKSARTATFSTAGNPYNPREPYRQYLAYKVYGKRILELIIKSKYYEKVIMFDINAAYGRSRP